MSERNEASQPLDQGDSGPVQNHAQDPLAESLSAIPASPQPADAPLPRPKRRRRRSKADRGLPPDEELGRLATEYLERQRKNWPEIARAGLLPEPSPSVIQAMVDDFKRRHRGGEVDPQCVTPFLKFCTKLGGNYDRYSCENSDPKSIIDQMVNCLDKARIEDRFIPWFYVFADYSISGLDASRQGYSSYKELLSDEEHVIDTTYIDDFTRASRDELEWWRLAAQSKRLNKRLIGASDNFDLSSSGWDIQVTVFGLLSRLFLRGLRQKVLRGMRGTARKGGNLGKRALGFALKIKRDEYGNVVLGRNDKPKKIPCWDPATKEDGYRMFQWFVVDCRSPYWIAREFNRRKVDGWDGWTTNAIKKMLWNPAYIGVFIWNKTRREYDVEEEKWLVVRNPRSEWEVHYDPKLAMIHMDWWRAARRKLAAARRNSPLTGRKRSRNQISATTLFSGTLFCGYCDQELKLTRSTGKYKEIGCRHGPTGAHGCKLKTSKATRIIEESLLRFIRDTLLTESCIEALVARANTYVKEEASRPYVDTSGWKAEVRKKEAAIKKLVIRVENQPDEKLCVGYDNRIRQLQKEVNDLRSKIVDAEARQNRSLLPLSVDQAKQYMLDFRETLNLVIPAAAEAIRTLTGPISIRQEEVPGRKSGARWTATFGPDLVRALRSVAKDAPSNLVFGDGTEPQTVEVEIDKIPKYEQQAPLFLRLHNEGASINSIAKTYHLNWMYVADIIHFAKTGERPKRPVPRRKKEDK